MSAPQVSGQLLLQLSQQFLVRNNPVQNLYKAVTTGLSNLLTFNSKMRLLKYKYMLARQQVNAMEALVQSQGIGHTQGGRINRSY